MKAMKFFLFLLLGTFVLFETALMAEIQAIEGKITAVNSENKSLTISPKDQTAGLPQEINLSVKDEDSFKNAGIKSLDELSVGDEIVVEAEQKDEGNWEVKNLQTAPASVTASQAGTDGDATLSQDRVSSDISADANLASRKDEMDETKPSVQQESGPSSSLSSQSNSEALTTESAAATTSFDAASPADEKRATA
jgi:hypothetical protein